MRESKIMTDEEMVKILESGTIAALNDADKAQVMAFAFGDKFIKSINKGERVTYRGAL